MREQVPSDGTAVLFCNIFGMQSDENQRMPDDDTTGVCQIACAKLGCSCWLIATGNRGLFARESADVEMALPEPGGVRELPAVTSQTVPLANPDFEQWDGWTPHEQEGFAIQTQPHAAHAGQACLRFDCSRQTRYVPSLRQKISGAMPGVYVLCFWLKLDGVSAQT